MKLQRVRITERGTTDLKCDGWENESGKGWNAERWGTL